MIEDPREAERRRQMGNESGCSCDEIADAFREVERGGEEGELAVACEEGGGEFRDISITPSSPLTALPALSPHCPPRPFPSLPSPSSPLTAPPALSPHSPPRPSPSLPSPPFPLTALPALPLRFPPRPFFSLPSPPFPLVSMPVPLCVPLPHPLRVRGPADRLVLVLRQLRTFPFFPSHRALSTPLSPPPSHPPLSPTLLAVPLSPTLLALPLSPTLLSPLGQPLPGYSEIPLPTPLPSSFLPPPPVISPLPAHSFFSPGLPLFPPLSFLSPC
ncbi:unnamed protein product [Closterium sp. NIES-64]|nr:unnamed protein product [Closterium sp. NIES-64]